MNNYLLFMFIFGCIMMGTSACEKDYDDVVLPKATETGANTLGCIINDSVYVPCVIYGWRRQIKFVSRFTEHDSAYSLETLNAEHFNYLNHVQLKIKGISEPGTYPLYDRHHFNYGHSDDICYYRSLRGGGSYFYWLDSTLSKKYGNNH